MKLIITILLLAISTFAQNTTYKDGTDCECDSIHVTDSYLDTIGGNPINILDDDFNRFMIDLRTNEVPESYHLTETPYKNGNIHGYEYYYNDSVMVGATKYTKGTIIEQKWFFVTGELNVHSKYKNGVITHSVMYYLNGALWNESYFDSGKLQGTKKWYFENGNLAGTATYKNGKLVGYKKCTDGRVGNENLDCLK